MAASDAYRFRTPNCIVTAGVQQPTTRFQGELPGYSFKIWFQGAGSGYGFNAGLTVGLPIGLAVARTDGFTLLFNIGLTAGVTVGFTVGVTVDCFGFLMIHLQPKARAE